MKCWNRPTRSWASTTAPVALEWALMLISTGIAFGGWFVARALYKDNKSEVPARMKERFAGIHKVIFNKYYVDEGYFYVFIRPLVNFSTFLWGFVDTVLVDGVLVRVSAWLVRSVAKACVSCRPATYRRTCWLF